MIPMIFWVLFGALIGWIASIVQDEKEVSVLSKNILAGIAGSIAGGIAGRALESGESYSFGNISMLLAISGGTLAIFVATLWKSRAS